MPTSSPQQIPATLVSPTKLLDRDGIVVSACAEVAPSALAAAEREDDAEMGTKPRDHAEQRHGGLDGKAQKTLKMKAAAMNV